MSAFLKSTIAGIAVEIQASGTVGEATGMNIKAANGEHFIEGTGTTTYSGVTVTAPAGKGCVVEGGKIVTNKLAGTSAGQGMAGVLVPAIGETFAEFVIAGCGPTEALKALNGIYKVTGSVKCGGDGATVLCSEAAITEQNTLKLRGQKAGIQVTTTATGRADGSEAFAPLAVTTVETP